MDNHRYIEKHTSASDSEDTLSLCDLSFTGDSPPDTLNKSPPEEAEKEMDDSFHFSANPNPYNVSPMGLLLIFGMSIPHNKPSNLQYTKEEEQKEEEQHRRSRISLFRSDSFNRPFSSFRRDGVKTEKFIADYHGRSNSIRLANKRSGGSLTAIGSGSLRKYKALMRPAKLPAKIELNEIRRRQSRLPPAPMFFATSNGIGRKSLWGLLRTLKSRSHIISALA